MQVRRQLSQFKPAARRGAAVVELALLVPLIGMAVLGICEVGQMLRVNAVLTDAVRKGCASAAKPGGTQSQMLQDIDGILKAAGLSSDEARIVLQVNGNSRPLSKAVRNDKITLTVAIPVEKTLWTGSHVFVTRRMMLSQSMSMLRQQ